MARFPITPAGENHLLAHSKAWVRTFSNDSRSINPGDQGRGAHNTTGTTERQSVLVIER